ncbi:MAG: hypothetical protein HKN85_00900 [Gammaproteobacteria bacterium]|nr:hypothetical protein [Gammaproteobacteria bacterium]
MSNMHILEQVIVASLEPMVHEAEEKGLWFYHLTEDGEEIWCSPGFLQKEQSEGRLVIAPEHWELRNPIGYMAKLANDCQDIVDEYNEMARRLKIEETLELITHSTNPADQR